MSDTSKDTAEQPTGCNPALLPDLDDGTPHDDGAEPRNADITHKLGHGEVKV